MHTPDNESRSADRSRRAFLGTTGGLALSFTIVPRHVLGGTGFVAPSDRVNVASIGVGGMGGGDVATVSRLGANIVALCDVDDERGAGSFGAFPKARRYKDFRKMLDKEASQIDAVTVGTPDHIHAVAAMAAIRAGKHVYCQKPLTHTLVECRELTRAGTAGRRRHPDGEPGPCHRGLAADERMDPGGRDRAGPRGPCLVGPGRPPLETRHRPSQGDSARPEYPGLGPLARTCPGAALPPAYAPVSWRGWRDFGTGALGDMGCHIIDHPVWALGLGAPTSVEARTTLDGSFLDGDKPNFETYPIAAIIYFEFPARGDLPPVRMTWYEGGLMPPDPLELPADQHLPDNGVLYIGSKGKMYHGSHGGMPELLPRELHQQAATVPKTMKRSPGHYEEWVEACKGGPRPVSNFDYAGPMTEIVLLGVLALRAPGRRLEWDSANLKVKNAPELNQYVHIEYRKGWTL